MPLTVACVLRSGGIYDASWVERLRDGIARHLQSDYRFLCLSDVAVPCERVPLEHEWPGWWAKLETFKLKGPVLYFDLDTAIVGDLSEVAAVAMYAKFKMLRDFYAGDHAGSGVMSWRDDVSSIYQAFKLEPERLMKVQRARMGDQAFIEEQPIRFLLTSWQDFLPGQIVSYKVHCRNGIPPNARVICLHGKPKFEDMPATDPVRLAWEMAA